MSKKRIIMYALIVFLLLPSISFAETQIKKYKIIKGDTLWDISAKELKDPFMWPNIWKENSWIDNPHLIYPGQVIKISQPATTSSEPVKKEDLKKEELKKETQIIKHPVVKESLIMKSGYLVDSVQGVGQIGDSPSGHTLFGNNDVVYIEFNKTAKVGDRFYVIRASEPVVHPITRKKIGYVVTISGIVEILKIKDGDTTARITKCFGEIATGDILDSYYDIEPLMTSGQFRSPNVNGMIVATGDQMILQSMLDITYIDKGCKDGIEPGDMFRTIAVGAHAVPNGTIQVIGCKDHTATAIIQSSIAPISPGNIFVKLDQDENKAELDSSTAK